ncbi:MAG: lysophospholipid acyltransferase family protein [Candidatus Omnitrophota bacterium]
MLYVLYAIGRKLALVLSQETFYKVAVFLADIYYIFARSDRRNLTGNLKVILKTNEDKVIKEHVRNVFRNFNKYLVDFFRFSELTRDYMISQALIEGKQNIDQALTAGKGAILVSAHIGNWELGGAIVASMGYELYAIALNHDDERIDNFFALQRNTAGMKTIPIGAQLKNCFKVLRKNNLLAIVGDRVFSDNGLEVNFFGRPTVLPKGPAFFNLRTGAPLIPTFTMRDKDGRFRMVFERPLETCLTGDEKTDIKRITESYVAVLEKYVRNYPDQWYICKKMWE